MKNLSTTKKGAIAETYVKYLLMCEGLNPLSVEDAGSPFDLLCIGPNLIKSFKIQVKTATFNGVYYEARLRKNVSCGEDRHYKENEVDIFAIYIHDTQDVFFIPFKDMITAFKHNYKAKTKRWEKFKLDYSWLNKV